MTASYVTNLDADLGDTVAIDAAQPPSPSVHRRPERGASRHEFDPKVDGQSVPSSVALRPPLIRSLRTVGPFVLSDLLSLAISALIAQSLVRFAMPGQAHLTPAFGAIVLAPLVVGYWLSELYSEIWVHPVVELRQLSHVTTFGLLAAGVAGATYSKVLPLWCGVAWLAAIVGVPMGRALTRLCCSWQRWWGYPALLICSGDDAHTFADTVLRAHKSGLRPIMMTDPLHACRSSILPVINDLKTLESLIRVEGIRHAVVSLPEFNGSGMAAALDRYSGLVPHLLVLSDCSTLPSLWGASRSCGRLSGIEVRNGLMLATLSLGKRVVDVAASLVALSVLAPLVLLAALLVKLSSPGPCFYGHLRIGRHGRLFRAWKFRTMFTDGEEILARHLAHCETARREWNEHHKLRDDPRVTRLGQLLRRTSIDELPQLWNVLRGDMSLVGPRPIVQSEASRYRGVFGMYTSIKPGITGLWQVSGRTEVGYEDRVLLDQFYVRHWSPWLDVYILARTVVALVRCRGAY